MRVLKKGIVIAGETHHVDLRLLTQRMLACISLDNIAEEPCNTTKCTCRRYGLPCSVVCKNCCGKDCTNTGDSFDLGEDEDEI